MYSCKCSNIVIQARRPSTSVSSGTGAALGMMRVELWLGGVRVKFSPMVVCSGLRDGYRIYKCGNSVCDMDVFAIPADGIGLKAPAGGKGVFGMPSNTLLIAPNLLTDNELEKTEATSDYCATFKMVLPQMSPLDSFSDVSPESKVSIMLDSIIEERVSNEKMRMDERIAAFIASERDRLKHYEDIAKGDKLRVLKALEGKTERATLKLALSDAMEEKLVEDAGDDVGDKRHDLRHKASSAELSFQRKKAPSSSPKSRGNRVSIGGVTTMTPPTASGSGFGPRGASTPSHRVSSTRSGKRSSNPYTEDVFGMDGVERALPERVHGLSESGTEYDQSDDDELVTGRHTWSRRSRDTSKLKEDLGSLATSVPISVPMPRHAIPLGGLESDGDSDGGRNHRHGGEDDRDRLAKSFAEASMMAQMHDSTSIFGVMPQTQARRRCFTFHT